MKIGSRKISTTKSVCKQMMTDGIGKVQMFKVDIFSFFDDLVFCLSFIELVLYMGQHWCHEE